MLSKKSDGWFGLGVGLVRILAEPKWFGWVEPVELYVGCAFVLHGS